MKSDAGLFGRPNPNALFIGAVAAVSVLAIGIGLVYFAARGDGDDGSGGSKAAQSGASSTSSTSSSSTTSTTVAGFGLPTTTTAPPSGAAPGSGAPLQPGRAYADPEDDPFEEVPLPPGITATITTCRWDPANGGELQASGTVTADPVTEDAWFVEIYWLQNDRELASQLELYDVEPGATISWNLVNSAPLPPAAPFRCALEIS